MPSWHFWKHLVFSCALIQILHPFDYFQNNITWCTLTAIRKVFPFPISPSLSFRLLESDKDIWMDSNQLYNIIQIRWNNPKKDSRESNSVKYAHVISDLIRNIPFHVNKLTYSSRFYLLLRIYGIETLRSPIQSYPASANNFLILGRRHLHNMKPFSSPFSVILTFTLTY